ncbi:glycosyltransferase family 1 protein [Mucilaginibacter terrenus]|uniref:Glycosyltransferase family 1 protein n=1 Tax=Mucilaginibacter terrenus TaxID=2482727 RepID=A0A3E2NUW8_9SPHI|nr:glycosyltransferase family 1 protein [Mucilaginibacter terrenus]RFZ84804.1 glycosyltransferase family 1 protein [Mucilaginibacter terrenus]
MIFAVDGVRLSRKPSGVTYIAVSLIKQLAAERPDWIIYVILRSEIHPLLNGVFNEHNIEFVKRPLPLFNNIGLLWSLIKLNRVVAQLKPDYYLSPSTYLYPFFNRNQIKQITFVHDMVFKKWPDTMSIANRILTNLLFKYSIRRADLIWCNSHYTADELKNYYPDIASNKKIFIGAGLNVDFKEALAQRFQISSQVSSTKKPYLFFVGTLEPRKNIELLLDIFKHVAERYDLIIVGGSGWGNTSDAISTKLNSSGYPKDQVKILPKVDLQDLIGLYSNAYCYLTTSFNEGLGLPLLEAMSCGCPVIAAHNSAMIEVVEGAGITVKSWLIDDWLSALKDIEDNREALVIAGYERLEAFQWKIVVQEFIAFISQP